MPPTISPLVIKNSSSYPEINPDGSGFIQGQNISVPYQHSATPSDNSIIYALSTVGKCDRCADPSYWYRAPSLDIKVLEEIAAGVINLPADDAEKRLYVMQEQLYRLVKENPDLVLNSSDLQQFIYDNQWSSLDFIYFIGKYLAEGKQDVADILLGMWSPGNNAEMDDNYKRYYEWMIQMTNNRDWMPDREAVLAVANLCPVKSGTIVYAYRNLYNAITQKINKFDNSCGGELGKGVKKTQGFIRLKAKSVLAESNKTSILYPNPASDIVTVKANNIHNITIFDVMGKVVIEKKVANENGPNVIDVKSLPNGIFMVKIVDSLGHVTTNKLIVQH